MKILVIGCGSIGARHIENILNLKNYQIIAFDIDHKRLEIIKSKHPNIVAINKLGHAWKLRPEIVFITAPTYLHIPFALDAAKYKCHLFIEKPLSHSLQNITRLEQLIKQNKLITLVGCNMRFYWAIAKIKDLLSEHIIGKVFSVQISAGSYLPDWHPHEDYRKLYAAKEKLGGGAIFDFIHELDYASWFFGEIETITGMYGKVSNLEIETEDLAEIICKFRAGPLVSIHMDYFERAYSRSCRIIGELGTIFWEFTAHTIKVFSVQTQKWKTIREFKNYDMNKMYIEELRYFFNCVRKDKSTFNEVFNGAKTLKQALVFKQKGTRVN